MRVSGITPVRTDPIEIPQELIDQLDSECYPQPRPTFGYNWKVKTLYKKGKLPTVKYDASGRRLTKDNVTIDHVIPHSKGGPTADGNLMLATKELNQMRGNRPLTNYMTPESLLQYIEQFIGVVVDGFNGNKYIKSLLKTLGKGKIE